MLSLELSVKRRQFRGEDALKETADAGFEAIRPKILQRDNYTCHYCNFRPADMREGNVLVRGKFQEVHHLDNNHRNNHESNLVTACALCHAVNHIGFAGMQGAAVLTYAFEGLSNADFNNLLRTMLIAAVMGDPKRRERVKAMYGWLVDRSTVVKTRLGTASPMDVGRFLRGVPDEQYGNREQYFVGVRLLLTTKVLEDQLSFWRDNVYKSVPPETWGAALSGIWENETPPVWLRHF